MNRMTFIAALACGFAFAAHSPALTQEKAGPGAIEGTPTWEERNVREGMEKDNQIDKTRREEMERQGRGATTSAPGAQEERNVREPQRK